MTLGFIVLRHVNSVETNKLWIECYNSIRKLYPTNKIVIIDDNSNYNFITPMQLDNTLIVQSEFPGRGEVLPYYYYSRNKWFDTAVILHDSAFIKQYIDFNVENYKLLWIIEHTFDQTADEKRIISALTNNTELLKFHENKQLWVGCFGCMTAITYDYLKMLDEKYTLANLLGVVTMRYNRCSFERVIACMLMANKTLYNFTLFGNIHKYYENVKRSFGYSYADYIKDNYNLNLPIVKIWYWREQQTVKSTTSKYRFTYGILDKNIEVTHIVMEKCVKDNIVFITKNDNVRRSLFSDPLPGIHKSIFINDQASNLTVVDEHHDVYIDLGLNQIYIDTPPEYIKQIWLNVLERLTNIHKQLRIDFGSLREEFPEQMMVATYLTGSEKVLEIGGNIGRNSLVIAHILNSNSNTQFVSLECDENIAKQLEHNRNINNLVFHIESSALSKRKLIQKGWDTVCSDELLDGYKPVKIISYTELIQKYNIIFDTLILDCEGAFYYILMDMPEILNGIKMIIMENDYGDLSKKTYVDTVLSNNGFKVVYVKAGGGGVCHNNFYEVWKKD